MATARCCIYIIMTLYTLLGHCTSLPLPFSLDADTSLDFIPTSQYDPHENAQKMEGGKQGVEAFEENRQREAPGVLFGGLTIPSHHMDRQSFLQSMSSRTDHGGEPFPLAWDSRTNPAFQACFASLAEVGDQGNCGSSWAIVASQSYHDALCLAAVAEEGGQVLGVTASQNATNQLSAMDVLTCTRASAVSYHPTFCL